MYLGCQREIGKRLAACKKTRDSISSEENEIVVQSLCTRAVRVAVVGSIVLRTH